MRAAPVPVPSTVASTRSGLSSTEAALRLAVDGPNLLPGNAPRATAAIVRGVLTEPMFLMLLAAGSVYYVLGDRAEASFLLAFVAVVIGITVVQERRTQRALEALRELSAPRAQVIRDGATQRIAGRDVVRGDLLALHEGDRVPADARLLEGDLSINESLLTGESVPVDKRPTPAAPRADSSLLLASTIVTRGIGVAEVEAVAAATAVGRIGESLVGTVEPPSALQQASRRLVRILGLAAFFLATLLVMVGWAWNDRPILESLLAGIALAMAILPEEIPLILTVFLALGAWRLSRQKVLTRRVSAVEALGAITVLAVDKTGTLTQNRMAVAELVADGQSFTSGDPRELPEAFQPLVEFAMLATPPDPFDPMEAAIQDFGRRRLAGTEHVHDDVAPEFEYPLSPEILAMTRVFAGAAPSRHVLATKGAPEAVADLCHLDAARREALRLEVERMAGRGLRVLGVAMGRWNAPPTGAGDASASWPADQHDFHFRFLGLVGLADPLRAEVPAALARCREAGVRVIMMTGDHPATARAIAREVGLSARPDVVTGAEIEALDDPALRARLAQVDLCARLQPHHKLRLVQALVLLDDSFARIVAAIRQGRRIYDNIEQATRFVFAVHVPVIALALVPALLGWPVLLLPVHIVLLELLIDPACSIVFEAEPEADDLMSRPPRRRGRSPFSRANATGGLLQGLGLAPLRTMMGLARPNATTLLAALVLTALGAVWLALLRGPDGACRMAAPAA